MIFNELYMRYHLQHMKRGNNERKVIDLYLLVHILLYLFIVISICLLLIVFICSPSQGY